MNGFMPSEIARLALGYLNKTDCTLTEKTFLNESPHLKEYAQCLTNGYHYPTTIEGRHLIDILQDYYLLTHIENNNDTSSFLIEKLGSAFTQLKSLLASNKTSDKISLPRTLIRENRVSKSRCKRRMTMSKHILDMVKKSNCQKSSVTVSRGVSRKVDDDIQLPKESAITSQEKPISTLSIAIQVEPITPKFQTVGQQTELLLAKEQPPKLLTDATIQTENNDQSHFNNKIQNFQINGVLEVASKKSCYCQTDSPLAITVEKPLLNQPLPSQNKSASHSDHSNPNYLLQKVDKKRITINENVASKSSINNCATNSCIISSPQHPVSSRIKNTHSKVTQILNWSPKSSTPRNSNHTSKNANGSISPANPFIETNSQLNSADKTAHIFLQTNRPKSVPVQADILNQNLNITRENNEFLKRIKEKGSLCRDRICSQQSPSGASTSLYSPVFYRNSNITSASPCVESPNDSVFSSPRTPKVLRARSVRRNLMEVLPHSIPSDNARTQAEEAWKIISSQAKLLEKSNREKEQVSSNPNTPADNYVAPPSVSSSNGSSTCDSFSPAAKQSTQLLSPIFDDITPLNSVQPDLPTRFPSLTSPRYILSQQRSLVPSLSTPVKDFSNLDTNFCSPRRKSQIPRRRLLSKSPSSSQTNPPETAEKNSSGSQSTTDDFMDYNSLLEDLLNYPPLIEKLAENINEVVSHESGGSQPTIQPVNQGQSNTMIMNILTKTESDPVFEDVLNMLFEKHDPSTRYLETIDQENSSQIASTINSSIDIEKNSLITHVAAIQIQPEPPEPLNLEVHKHIDSKETVPETSLEPSETELVKKTNEVLEELNLTQPPSSSPATEFTTLQPLEVLPNSVWMNSENDNQTVCVIESLNNNNSIPYTSLNSAINIGVPFETTEFGTCIRVLNQPIMSTLGGTTATSYSNAVVVNAAVTPVKIAIPDFHFLTVSPSQLYGMPFTLVDQMKNAAISENPKADNNCKIAPSLGSFTKPAKPHQPKEIKGANNQTLLIKQTMRKQQLLRVKCKPKKTSIPGFQKPRIDSEQTQSLIEDSLQGVAILSRNLDFGRKDSIVGSMPIISTNKETINNKANTIEVDKVKSIKEKVIQKQTTKIKEPNGRNKQTTLTNLKEPIKSTIKSKQNNVSSTQKACTKDDNQDKEVAATLVSLVDCVPKNNKKDLLNETNKKNPKRKYPDGKKPFKARKTPKLLEKMDVDKFLETIHPSKT